MIKETEYEWIIKEGNYFFPPSEITYRKIEYFSKREIKEFKTKKPTNKSQENKALQNTDLVVLQKQFDGWNIISENRVLDFLK